MPDTTLTLRPELAAGLDELPASRGTRRDELLEEAIASYLAYSVGRHHASRTAYAKQSPAIRVG